MKQKKRIMLLLLLRSTCTLACKHVR